MFSEKNSNYSPQRKRTIFKDNPLLQCNMNNKTIFTDSNRSYLRYVLYQPRHTTHSQKLCNCVPAVFTPLFKSLHRFLNGGFFCHSTRFIVILHNSIVLII